MKQHVPRALVLLSTSLLVLAASSLASGQQTVSPTAPDAATNAPAASSTSQAAPASAAQPTPVGDIKIIKDGHDLSPTTKAFVHPGIYYNASDLAFMRKKLADHAEPWTSAWEQNKPNAAEDGWQPHASAEWDCYEKPQGFYMEGDPTVAHKEALAWAMTGNQANADVAIKILNAWSSTLQSIKEYPQMPQQKLASGACFAQLCNAAELLVYGGPDGKKSGWADADIQKFKAMLQLPYKEMTGFYSGYNGNWDMLMMDSMISMAVFSDDPKMFDEVLQHYIVGTPPNGGITYYVSETGQPQEAYRDWGHVQWGLGNAVAVCEVAWKQGIDIYGAYDNRLMKGLEYTAKFNLGSNDVPYEGKGQISQKARGDFAPIWEAPYQHYVVRRGLEMPYTKQILEGTNLKQSFRPVGVYRPEGPEGDLTVDINWGTFTMYKGDEDPQAAKKQ